ncbi:hypothetical protein LTR53_007305 [Teratosphaeriaceae sp. CCFEE 6253]|nr:hypothetical protein LTR53_007305 [Teratosphaeriaceae sp. CCFEE 6253]
MPPKATRKTRVKRKTKAIVAPQPPFRIMDLPPEMRLIIYEHILPSGKSHTSVAFDGANPEPPQSICRVTSLLRKESLPVWRASSAFALDMTHPYEKINIGAINDYLYSEQDTEMHHVKYFTLSENLHIPSYFSVEKDLLYMDVHLTLHVVDDEYNVQAEQKRFAHVVQDKKRALALINLKIKLCATMLEAMLGRSLHGAINVQTPDVQMGWTEGDK